MVYDYGLVLLALAARRDMKGCRDVGNCMEKVTAKGKGARRCWIEIPICFCICLTS